jgi:hypothetical protein
MQLYFCAKKILCTNNNKLTWRRLAVISLSVTNEDNKEQNNQQQKTTQNGSQN